MKFDIVITRHRALVEYLLKRGLIIDTTQVISDVRGGKVELIRGKHVIGVLPHALSCLCASFTEIPMNVPFELRGTELTIEQVEQFAQPIQTYFVRTQEEEETIQNKLDVLTTFFFESENEWGCFKDYLLNGESPFNHDLFVVCQALGDFFAFGEYVAKFADDEYKTEYLEYLESIKS